MVENKQTTPKENAPTTNSADFEKQIIAKVDDAENILVALSRNPSVDEIAAAIGLTLFLNQTGKHVTAIYSGETPNVLEFLKPEGTFEGNTDSLQDFIIALNKEKADHIRYKLDGDYVKIYITPYKTTISDKDLEFSHGDYNVDLVIALNVPTASDLDTALNEHGRIMHDAGAINITAGEAGKFGEIEWNDVKASSVSEMVGRLLLRMSGEDLSISKEEATALMTGIMAATQRFSNEKTTPEVMNLAGKLMELGADQKLIANNIENQTALMGAVEKGRMKKGDAENAGDGSDVANNSAVEEVAEPEEPKDPTLLNVREEVAQAAENASAASAEPVAAVEPVTIAEPAMATNNGVAAESVVAANNGVADVTASAVTEAVDNVAAAPTVITEPVTPVEPVATAGPAAATEPAATAESATTAGSAAAEPLPIPMPETIETENTEEDAPENVGAVEGIVPSGGEKVLTPPPEEPQPEVKDYGAMIDAALAEGVPTGPTEPVAAEAVESVVNPAAAAAPAVESAANPAAAAAPAVASAPEENHLPELDYGISGAGEAIDNATGGAMPADNGAGVSTTGAMSTPVAGMDAAVATEATPVPSVEQGTNGVLPMPGGETLPPPPTPPVDFNNVSTAAEMTGGLPPVMNATTANGAVANDTVVNGAVAQPVETTMGVQSVEQVAAQPAVGQAATDPAAFRIPGA